METEIDYSAGWKCPKCGKITHEWPALSRRDNKTEICSDCGTREAIEDWNNRCAPEQRLDAEAIIVESRKFMEARRSELEKRKTEIKEETE